MKLMNFLHAFQTHCLDNYKHNKKIISQIGASKTLVALDFY